MSAVSGEQRQCNRRVAGRRAAILWREEDGGFCPLYARCAGKDGCAKSGFRNWSGSKSHVGGAWRQEKLRCVGTERTVGFTYTALATREARMKFWQFLALLIFGFSTILVTLTLELSHSQPIIHCEFLMSGALCTVATIASRIAFFLGLGSLIVCFASIIVTCNYHKMKSIYPPAKTAFDDLPIVKLRIRSKRDE